MVSGLYKYIVFDPIERSTGKVYDEPCHRIMGHAVELPNTDWVARRTTGACRCTIGRRRGRRKEGRSCESPRHGRIGLHRLARRRPARRGGHEPRIFDLVRSRSHVARGRLRGRRHPRCRRAARSAARLRRGHPPRRRGRRRRGRARPAARRSRERARHRGPARGRARRGRPRMSSTAARSGCTATPPGRRRSTRTRCSCRPTTSTRRRSSRARCTAARTRQLYGLEPTILRFGIPHGPALARADGRRARSSARALAGEPLSDQRRRRPGAAVRVRRGSGRRHRGGARTARRRAAPTTSSATRP